jgi:hypothetical protein
MHRSYSFYALGYRTDGCDKRNRDLALYAAALGQKRGVLPINLGGVRATITARTYQQATVVFERDTAVHTVWPVRTAWETFASVTVRNLDAWPAEPVEEMVGDTPSAAAQAGAGAAGEPVGDIQW